MLSVHLNALTDHKIYKIEQYITPNFGLYVLR